MSFRERLLATLHAARPVLDEPGIIVAQPADIDELEHIYRTLPAGQRYTARSNLSVLSLLESRAQMPDPVPHRARLAQLMARLEKAAPPSDANSRQRSGYTS